MLADVPGDRRRKQVVAGVPGGEPLTEIRGGNVVVYRVEQVDPIALCSRKLQAFRQLQRYTRPADNDPLSQIEELSSIAPLANGAKAVGARDREELVLRLLRVQSGKRVDRVVGSSVWPGGVEG